VTAFGQRRFSVKRVRAFIEWLAPILRRHLSDAPSKEARRASSRSSPKGS
jgi:hypothetical protein